MDAEKRKDFTKTIELINERHYDKALEELNVFLNHEDEEKKAYANYLIGYINTCWGYKKKNERLARQKLYDNINGDYPQAYAFVLYFELIKDKNIAENYIRKGIQLFPNNPQLFKALLKISNNKNEVIHQIVEKGFCDIPLLGDVISYLFKTHDWNKIGRFIFRIEKGNKLNDFEKHYLDLISAYSLLFKEKPNYENAIDVFEKLIAEDTDNNFDYAHYMGILYAFIQIGDYEKAIEFFDKLPVSNTLCDFDDRPWPLNISINFETIYKVIFEKLFCLFSKDQTRKNKAAVLNALYLYHPSILYDIYRYRKSDSAALARYLKKDFNLDVASALYNMRCHFKQFKEAYEVLWLFIEKYEDPDSETIFFSEITEEATEKDMLDIVDVTLQHLDNDDYDIDLFLSSVFPDLIEKLYKNKQYEQICSISEYFTVEQIINSKSAFSCAYSYAKSNHKRAIELYEEIIKIEPNNSAAINNLGVQYEHKKELFKALDCYEKALSLKPSDEIHRGNLNRIHELIEDQTDEELSLISELISLQSLSDIGFTTDLCKRILKIEDEDMKGIIFRDLKECAIAVVSGQDKTATIMCGSIIEALLMLKIKAQGIAKYDISEISKSSKASKYPLIEMGLNELLFVAEKLNIIAKNSFHLGHYIRDYRNVVHPAKEIRMKEEISHSNVLTMWSVLKRIIEELF